MKNGIISTAEPKGLGDLDYSYYYKSDVLQMAAVAKESALNNDDGNGERGDVGMYPHGDLVNSLQHF